MNDEKNERLSVDEWAEKHRVKEPKIKVGDIVRCYNRHVYKVLKVSNTYDEVSEYDSMKGCLDVDLENILYCAVEKEFAQTALPHKYTRTFVFLISRDSRILGE